MDNTSLEQLFKDSYQKAYRAAKAICFDTAAAEDCVAEALIRLWKTIERGKGVEKAESYFVRIAVNEAKRACTKRREIPSENIAEYLEADAGHADDAAYREAAENLLHAVESLGKRLTLPIKLHYYGGFSEKETAELLGISYSALKTRMSRGRAKLRGMLENGREANGENYDEIQYR